MCENQYVCRKVYEEICRLCFLLFVFFILDFRFLDF